MTASQISSSSTLCLRCAESTRRMSPVAADLVEGYELCPPCRRADVDERLAFIRAEIRDLARDVEPYAERGQLDDDQEAAIAVLVATLAVKVLGVSAA